MPKTAKKQTESEPILPIEKETLRGLQTRAEAGEKNARIELRRRIIAREDFESPYASISVLAETALVSRFTDSNGKRDLYKEETMHHKIQLVREELAGPDPTPLERALADRAALCWFQVNGDLAMEAACGKLNGQDLQEFFSKRQERAHRMYLSSLKALAQIRRLQLPSVQVNIGEKQINVQR